MFANEGTKKGHTLRLASRGARMVQLRRLSGTRSHPPISLLGRLHFDGRPVAALHTVRLALGRRKGDEELCASFLDFAAYMGGGRFNGDGGESRGCAASPY